MDILFLGTSAAVPSRDRSTSCIAVREGSDVVLLDCGEGAQRQLMRSPFSFMKVRAILITHLHGDHVFGLPCLLQTMGLSNRQEPLTVYGPPGLRLFVDQTMTITEGDTSYPLDVVELDGGERFSVKGFECSCFGTDHGIASLGFVLRAPNRPGRLDREKALRLGLRDGPDMARVKRGETVNGVSPEDVVGPEVPGPSVCYTGDTRPCEGTAENARGATVLIHEATYMSTESRNAEEHGHSTALQAAEVARAAGVGSLIMTHVSHRYEDRGELEEEARAVFPNSYAADDLVLFEIGRDGVRPRDVRPA